MEKLWIEKPIKYEGHQLKPLANYLNHGPLGDSIVGWRGACEIPLDHMLDGEDLKASSSIKGDDMLHFILELFDFPLSSAVSFQRLMGEIIKSQLQGLSPGAASMERQGDDLYWQKGKFNISIATCSSNSSLIHFGLNVTNRGTPVKTCALEDFGIKTEEAVISFAHGLMTSVQNEFLSLKRATRKVRCF